MICAMSDDLPEPRPPLHTTCSLDGSKAARQTEWKAFGIKSLNRFLFAIIITDSNVVDELNHAGNINLFTVQVSTVDLKDMI